jgi:hypothetical protein
MADCEVKGLVYNGANMADCKVQGHTLSTQFRLVDCDIDHVGFRFQRAYRCTQH